MEYTRFICNFVKTNKMRDNITYSLTFKILNESITYKKDSPSLHVGQVMSMHKSLIITLFGEESYKNAIFNEVNKLLECEDDVDYNS